MLDNITLEAFDYIMTVATRLMNERDEIGFTYITRWTGIVTCYSDDSYVLGNPLTNKSELYIGAYRTEYIGVNDNTPREILFSLDIPETFDKKCSLTMKIINDDGKYSLERRGIDQNDYEWEEHIKGLIDNACVRVGVISDNYPDMQITRKQVAHMISKFYRLETPLPEGLISLTNMAFNPHIVDIVATLTADGRIVLSDVNPIRFGYDKWLISWFGEIDNWPPLYTCDHV